MLKSMYKLKDGKGIADWVNLIFEHEQGGVSADAEGELSGVYVWNEPIPLEDSDSFDVPVNFTSNGTSYTNIKIYNGNMNYDSYGVYMAGAFYMGEAYRTMDFGSKQTGIDVDFWNFLQAHTVKQSSVKPFVTFPVAGGASLSSDLEGLMLKAVQSYSHSGSAVNVDYMFRAAGSVYTVQSDGIYKNNVREYAWADVTDYYINKLVASGDMLKSTKDYYAFDYSNKANAFAHYVNGSSQSVYFLPATSDITMGTASKVSFAAIDSTIIKNLGDWEVIEYVAEKPASDAVERVMFTGHLGQRLIACDNDSTTVFPTIWQYDIFNSAWRKLFPLDAMLDINSFNGVTNKAITTGIENSAHYLAIEMDESVTPNVINIILKDANNKELNRVKFTLNGAITTKPVAHIAVADTSDVYAAKLLKKIDEPVVAGSVKVRVAVEKTDKDIASVKLYFKPTGGSETEITTGWSVLPDTNTYTFDGFTLAGSVAKGTFELYAKVADIDGNEADVEIAVIKFVQPVLYGTLADASSEQEKILDDINCVLPFTCDYDRPYVKYDLALGELTSIGGCENPNGRNAEDVNVARNFVKLYENVAKFVEKEHIKVATYADLTVDSEAGTYLTEDTKQVYVIETKGTVPAEASGVSVTESLPTLADSKSSASVDAYWLYEDVLYIGETGAYTDDLVFVQYTLKEPCGLDNYYLCFQKD